MTLDALKELQNIRNIDKEDILGALGLQSKSAPTDFVLPVLGIFSAGLLVGAGIGMLMAPRTGRAMRKEIGKRVNDVTERALGSKEEARN